jgi:UPF0042 nucleotide-binding protein
MKSFEDLGFHCVDNLPPRLAVEVVALCARSNIAHLALAPDIRSGGPFGDAQAALAELRERGFSFELLYLEARDDVVIRRYSETRRRHPYERAGQSLSEAIAVDRAALAPLRSQADRVWDTSQLTQSSLKTRVAAAFADAENDALSVRIVAFGFKHGIPLDADLVFDVRFLPNPNYVPELQPLTGADARVAAFLAPLSATIAFLERLRDLLDFLIPQYVREGKSRLTVAIGCTGGRHRSVYIAEELGRALTGRPGIEVAIEHRDAATTT